MTSDPISGSISGCRTPDREPGRQRMPVPAGQALARRQIHWGICCRLSLLSLRYACHECRDGGAPARLPRRLWQESAPVRLCPSEGFDVACHRSVSRKLATNAGTTGGLPLGSRGASGEEAHPSRFSRPRKRTRAALAAHPSPVPLQPPYACCPAMPAHRESAPLPLWLPARRRFAGGDARRRPFRVSSFRLGQSFRRHTPLIP